MSVFLMGVRAHQRCVQVDHDLGDPPEGREGAPKLVAGQFPTRSPGPVPPFGSGLPDAREHHLVDPASTGQIVEVDATDPAGHRTVQTFLISERPNIADRDRAVRDRDSHVDQHPARMVTCAAFPQSVGGLAQQGRQPDPIRQLGQPHRTQDVVERDVMLRAVRCLPRRQREAVSLLYYADLTEAQTAQVMGVRVGAAVYREVCGVRAGSGVPIALG